MTSPLEPHLPDGGDDGIPAADAGHGAPPPAEGFGVTGEEPDAPEQDGDDALTAHLPSETPFRAPDPTEVGPTS